MGYGNAALGPATRPRRSASGRGGSRHGRRSARRPLAKDRACRTILFGIRGQAQMPTQHPLKTTKERSRKPAEIPYHFVAILHVFRNAVGENMIHSGFGDA